MLIISYRPHTTVYGMGHIVDSHPSQTIVHYATSDGAIINHIAHINAWNDPEADAYTHICVYDQHEHDQHEPPGAINQQDIQDLDLNNTSNHIPTHLHDPIQKLQAQYEQNRKAFETSSLELEKVRRTEIQRENDRQFETLRKKLNK